MTATAPATQTVAGSTTVDVRTGLPIALCSAAAFALSGSLASSLLVTGWSPAAVVAARVGGAFLVLLIPCLLLLRRIGLPTGRATGRMVAYGVVAVARRPALLLQRRPAPVGRGGAAAGVPRSGAADRLLLVAPRTAPERRQAGRRRPGHGRSGAGAGPDRRRPDQPGRGALGPGCRRVPVRLLRPVGEQRLVLARPAADHRGDRRRRRGAAARRPDRDRAADGRGRAGHHRRPDHAVVGADHRPGAGARPPWRT